MAAVELIWHILDSQGQILALAFRGKSLNTLDLFPVRSAAAWTEWDGGAGERAQLRRREGSGESREIAGTGMRESWRAAGGVEGDRARGCA